MTTGTCNPPDSAQRSVLRAVRECGPFFFRGGEPQDWRSECACIAVSAFAPEFPGEVVLSVVERMFPLRQVVGGLRFELDAPGAGSVEVETDGRGQAVLTGIAAGEEYGLHFTGSAHIWHDPERVATGSFAPEPATMAPVELQSLDGTLRAKLSRVSRGLAVLACRVQGAARLAAWRARGADGSTFGSGYIGLRAVDDGEAVGETAVDAELLGRASPRRGFQVRVVEPDELIECRGRERERVVADLCRSFESTELRDRAGRRVLEETLRRLGVVRLPWEGESLSTGCFRRGRASHRGLRVAAEQIRDALHLTVRTRQPERNGFELARIEYGFGSSARRTMYAVLQRETEEAPAAGTLRLHVPDVVAPALPRGRRAASAAGPSVIVPALWVSVERCELSEVQYALRVHRRDTEQALRESAYASLEPGARQVLDALRRGEQP
jgi:hypothetical protein